MTEPSKPKEGDEVCPMCGRPKSKHSSEELLTCSRKRGEFKKNITGGLELNEYLQTVNAGTNETQTFFDSNLVPL